MPHTLRHILNSLAGRVQTAEEDGTSINKDITRAVDLAEKEVLALFKPNQLTCGCPKDCVVPGCLGLKGAGTDYCADHL